jgi:predicted O-methyltransferase YrrM
MDFLPADIEQYASDHSDPEPELLYRLHRETWQKVIMPRMLSGHFQGRFLSLVSRLKSPQRILEIGAYTGYSAICLCEGLQPGGRLDTIEVNPELAYLQDKYWSEAGLSDRIHRYIGKALDVLPTLDGPYDLVFIDADKENYPAYYELALERTRKGGLLLIDNVLWSGKVTTAAAPNDRETRILQELNDFIATDQRVSKVLLPIRDGVFALIRQ